MLRRFAGGFAHTFFALIAAMAVRKADEFPASRGVSSGDSRGNAVRDWVAS
jgi:hypothetical protein